MLMYLGVGGLCGIERLRYLLLVLNGGNLYFVFDRLKWGKERRSS